MHARKKHGRSTAAESPQPPPAQEEAAVHHFPPHRAHSPWVVGVNPYPHPDLPRVQAGEQEEGMTAAPPPLHPQPPVENLDPLACPAALPISTPALSWAGAMPVAVHHSDFLLPGSSPAYASLPVAGTFLLVVLLLVRAPLSSACCHAVAIVSSLVSLVARSVPTACPCVRRLISNFVKSLLRAPFLATLTLLAVVDKLPELYNNSKMCFTMNRVELNRVKRGWIGLSVGLKKQYRFMSRVVIDFAETGSVLEALHNVYTGMNSLCHPGLIVLSRDKLCFEVHAMAMFSSILFLFSFSLFLCQFPNLLVPYLSLSSSFSPSTLVDRNIAPKTEVSTIFTPLFSPVLTASSGDEASFGTDSKFRRWRTSEATKLPPAKQHRQ
nr:hypothetical protein Iba_chr02eCG0620 [Ipomoea batatas]